MDKMAKYMLQAAEALGLEIVAPFRCDLADGTKVLAVAHLPELRNVNGTLVFRTNQLDRSVFGILQGRGFSCSSFSEPLEREEFDLEVYREVFADWGWASESKEPPSWLTVGEPWKH